MAQIPEKLRAGLRTLIVVGVSAYCCHFTAQADIAKSRFVDLDEQMCPLNRGQCFGADFRRISYYASEFSLCASCPGENNSESCYNEGGKCSDFILDSMNTSSNATDERANAIGGAIFIVGVMIAIGIAGWIIATLPKYPEIKNGKSQLNSLASKNKVERIGNGRAARWRLVN